jgi:hypothetical protein
MSAALVFSGCATMAKYPVEQVPFPTEVTVYYDFAGEKGAVSNRLPLLPAGVWEAAFGTRIRGILRSLDSQAIIDSIPRSLKAMIAEYPALFTFDGAVEKVPVALDIPKGAPKNYSGYDFSSLKDAIKTRYILLYRLQEYGYLVAENLGAGYIGYSMGLIDKDTNQILWSTRSEAMIKAKGAFPHASVTKEELMGMYEPIINNSIRLTLVGLKE